MTETQSSGGGGLSVGDVVADRYRIEAVLGEGGMGVVYRAEHLHLRKPFALKVLLREWTSSTEIVARFEREAVAAGNIQSPHVAAATDFGRLPDGTFFLVMEYVEGRTLGNVLDEGAMSPARALYVARGIAAGLHAAHSAGVVHRDMKPENVMLVQRDGDPDFVKILDFGIAKVEPVGPPSAAGANPLTRVGSVMGTPDYMSPEQALGQAVDARTDQYALGVMLFEMLTGNRPFEGDAVSVLRQRVMSPPPELPPSLSGNVDARLAPILRRLLATAPENRFANAAEALAAIDECGREARPAIVVSPPTSADSTPAVTTPIATRARQSLSAVLLTLRQEARVVLANPASLLGPKRGVLVSCIAVLAFVVVGLTMLAVRSGGPAENPSPASSHPATASDPGPSATSEQESVADLPPPPSP
ncbi:MAG TPA: serine/threonine-protein kinase, partial [Polyangiaceae bacterium]